MVVQVLCRGLGYAPLSDASGARKGLNFGEAGQVSMMVGGPDALRDRGVPRMSDRSRVVAAQPVRVLFDGKVFEEARGKREAARSGIFFSAYELLLALVRRQDVLVTVMCSVDSKHSLAWSWSSLSPGLAVPVCSFEEAARGAVHSPGLDPGFDIFFSPAFAIPTFILGMPNILRCVLLHDTIPIILPHFFSSRTWFDDLAASINSRDYYVAVSHNTKADFSRFLPDIDPEKTLVSHLAASGHFYPETNREKIEAVRLKYGIPSGKDYVLSLCNPLDPRKNLPWTMEQFKIFTERHKVDSLLFVVAGGGAWAGGVVLPKADGLFLRLGYVDDEDRASLYSGAKFFVYLSLYEGFGLPPLEAMQCGCPVVTSNNSSLPEVVADAGIMIDPQDGQAFIKACERLYFDRELRDQYSQKGLIRSRSFSWDRFASDVVAHLRKGLELLDQEDPQRAKFLERQPAFDPAHLKTRELSVCGVSLLRWASFLSSYSIFALGLEVFRWSKVFGRRRLRIFGVSFSWRSRDDRRAGRRLGM